MDALPPEVARFRAIPMSIVRLEHVFKDYTLGEQKFNALKDISLHIEEALLPQSQAHPEVASPRCSI